MFVINATGTGHEVTKEYFLINLALESKFLPHLCQPLNKVSYKTHQTSRDSTNFSNSITICV